MGGGGGRVLMDVTVNKEKYSSPQNPGNSNGLIVRVLEDIYPVGIQNPDKTRF